MAGFIHIPMVDRLLVLFTILWWGVGWFHAQSYGGGFIHNSRVEGWLVSFTILWWRVGWFMNIKTYLNLNKCVK